MLKIKLSILLGFVCILSIVAQSYAESKTSKYSTAEEYDLAEKCGRSAAKYFHEAGYETREGIKFTEMHSYTYHYNEKLNKCFILLWSLYIPTNSETLNKLGTSIMKELIDIPENVTVGFFYKYEKVDSPDVCMVLGQTCHTESDWDLRVSPFLTE